MIDFNEIWYDDALAFHNQELPQKTTKYCLLCCNMPYQKYTVLGEFFHHKLGYHHFVPQSTKARI